MNIIWEEKLLWRSSHLS